MRLPKCFNGYCVCSWGGARRLARRGDFNSPKLEQLHSSVIIRSEIDKYAKHNIEIPRCNCFERQLVVLEYSWSVFVLFLYPLAIIYDASQSDTPQLEPTLEELTELFPLALISGLHRPFEDILCLQQIE
jgi:hypothetical protein